MISVVILVHNKPAMTLRCLSTLARSLDGIDHEVLCFDQASTDDVASLQDAAGLFRRFRLIRNRKNFSFSIANNLAVDQCAGDTLLFLNNDVMTGAGSMRALMEALREDSMN